MFDLRLTTASPAQTADLAADLARLLSPGDVVLLQGPIGAGKTHLARSLIRVLQGPDMAEDIPSPTFTLVQTYDTPRGEVWHADLYRLTDLTEVLELGLDEAFETAICLVEWPDRLGDAAPEDALTITLAPAGETERAIAVSGSADWAARMADLAARWAAP
ncbi:tRNA (adenosine(37)-N6)-threonylcarbamoyltransferase complex ATPase subunit type 1 TsaE [Oceaniglobus trochenteri]|uniref:tRNA (adenosine(37)-N6)-threonylcarbamoyltransferase complex ATPase subunit type 1 TsaE n=1 Tax=Oceaniglobus trochenteri TaxID=2763260 RepID=UPI001CFFAB8F|nr:tRNA (adenosine(37)-N6)-threonylcarbamoyltransferase complex ATPase subunit type 1 TsaE [Oceaniglobus trochenteri]